MSAVVAAKLLGIETSTSRQMERELLLAKMRRAWPLRERAARNVTMPAVGLRASTVLTAMKRSGLIT